MKKTLIGGALILSMILPLAASAATITNNTFSNGDVTIGANGGSSINGTLHVVVGQNEVVQFLGVKVDSLAEKCTAVNYQQGTYDIPYSAVVPPNTGSYSFNARVAGKWGGVPSVDCGDNVIANISVGNAVTVLPGSSSTTVGGVSQLSELLAALKALLQGNTAPAPTQSTACANLTAKMMGTQSGTYNPANIKLQGFLLSEGESIPALAAGASFGFFGSQTQAAVNSYRTAHNCN